MEIHSFFFFLFTFTVHGKLLWVYRNYKAPCSMSIFFVRNTKNVTWRIMKIKENFIFKPERFWLNLWEKVHSARSFSRAFSSQFRDILLVKNIHCSSSSSLFLLHFHILIKKFSHLSFFKFMHEEAFHCHVTVHISTAFVMKIQSWHVDLNAFLAY